MEFSFSLFQALGQWGSIEKATIDWNRLVFVTKKSQNKNTAEQSEEHIMNVK